MSRAPARKPAAEEFEDMGGLSRGRAAALCGQAERGQVRGPHAARAGAPQDFSENRTSAATMSARPAKKRTSNAKWSAGIAQDIAREISAVSAGTRLRNIETKPLSPAVTVRAT